jgi:diadenosine tetraphosphate (Ap4A) HIT family hydrolase
VSAGHTLVLPCRHVSSYFECTDEEKAALWVLVDRVKERLDREHRPDGFNVGINVGVAAGQTVPHCHVHVIPRYAGDVLDPTGGVRSVIPAKRNYLRP